MNVRPRGIEPHSNVRKAAATGKITGPCPVHQDQVAVEVEMRELPAQDQSREVRSSPAEFFHRAGPDTS